MHPRRGRQRAFTLIEAVVTMAVVAVLGALALPSLGARSESARLASAAEQLAADLADARFESARRGTPLHLAALGGQRWCWTVATSPGCACGLPQPCQLKSVQGDEHPGVMLAVPFAMHVDPAGGTGGAAAVLEGRRGDRLRVGLSPSGRARICSETAVVAASLSRYPRC